MDLWGIPIGRRLANREGKARKITALEGGTHMRQIEFAVRLEF